MEPAQKTGGDRILFLDNTRYLMVLLVVIFHSALAYNSQGWPVKDYNSEFFDYVTRTLDIFLMPVLFFIAGYFALPSLHKKNTWLFVKNKIKRLGIPWLVGVMLMGPIKDFIHYYSVSHGYINLWNAFLTKMKIAFTFGTGIITQTPEFNHLHFWFISLLFFFFIVFALLHKAMGKLKTDSFSSNFSEIPSNRQILLILFLVSIVTTALTLITFLIFSQDSAYEPWITIGSVIQFQPTRISLHILCFSLGIYAFYKNWFINGNIPGNYVFWTILSVVLWFGHEKLLSIFLENLKPIVAVCYTFTRTLLFFSMLLTFISYGERFWDSSSKVNRSLAKNSYNIYLVHMVFVFLIQLLLLDWPQLSVYIKFLAVSLSAILLSYAFSRYSIRPYPKLSVAGMIGIFAVLSIFTTLDDG
jgi:acyltransferase-like protein